MRGDYLQGGEEGGYPWDFTVCHFSLSPQIEDKIVIKTYMHVQI